MGRKLSSEPAIQLCHRILAQTEDQVWRLVGQLLSGKQIVPLRKLVTDYDALNLD